jgi:hypothetical protein
MWRLGATVIPFTATFSLSNQSNLRQPKDWAGVTLRRVPRAVGSIMGELVFVRVAGLRVF